MPEIIIPFGISDPVRFLQRCSGEEYEARVNGKAHVNEYDQSRYASQEDLVKMIRSKIKEVMEDSLTKVPENDVVASVNTGILGPYLSEGFEAFGIKADFEIVAFKLTEESTQMYVKSAFTGGFGMPGGFGTAGAPKAPALDELPPENHGPVTEVQTSYYRSGMMMGDITNSKTFLLWQEDGSLLIQKYIRDCGKATDLEIQSGREAADQLRKYIAENHIAEMAQVKPIPCPFQPTDVSRSSSMTIIFDDSSLGGDKRVQRTLDCRSDWKVLSDAVSEIRNLIGECESTGCVISQKEFTYDRGKPMTASVPDRPKWKCECGQENTGKYCVNCGLAQKS